MTGFDSKRQAAQDKMELADAYASAVAATPNMPTPLERKLAVERIERARNALEAALEQQAEPVQERITHITWDERGVRTVNGIPDDAPQQQQAEPPPEWPLIKNILAVFGLDAIAFVAEWKAAQQQAEPVATFQDGVLEGQLREREYWVKQQAEPVAWDVFELRLYGAPQQKQHRVLWVDRYTQPDGSTPDLDGLLEAAKTEGGIDGGAKTLHVRPLYSTPPKQQAEPTCPDCKAAVLYECVACSSNNYPPQQQAEPPQRPWEGLTVKERNDCLVSADPCEALADPEAKQLMEDIEEKLRSKNT